MRLKLSYKIFGAFLITSFAMIVLTIITLRLFLYRDFADYVRVMEKERVPMLVEALESEYREQKGWGRLSSTPGAFERIVESVLSPGSGGTSWTSFETQGLERRGERRHGREKDRYRREPSSVSEYVFLLDAQKRRVAGSPNGPGTETLTEIRVDAKTVGWLGMSDTAVLSSPHDIAFMDKAYNLLYMTGAAILLLAGLAAFFLSRHLLAPVKRLTEGTRLLTSRNLQARIDVRSKDELGQLASDFNIMASALETHEKIRQQWISDISHELRTPLSILRGEIEALQDGVREMSRETLDSLHAEVARVSKIVDDLHKLSLADTDSLVLRKETISPIQVLKETLGSYRTRFEQQEMTFELDLDMEPEAFILADTDRLRDVFSNLFENTLRYADSPGTLRIWKERRDKVLVLYFEDSGPGVPRKSLHRLFDRLYRVDKSRSRAFGGSGLGLSICKSIVEAHDGQISAHEGASGGLKIKIVLPLA